jgi:hypothetical protein
MDVGNALTMFEKCLQPSTTLLSCAGMVCKSTNLNNTLNFSSILNLDQGGVTLKCPCPCTLALNCSTGPPMLPKQFTLQAFRG